MHARITSKNNQQQKQNQKKQKKTRKYTRVSNCWKICLIISYSVVVTSAFRTSIKMWFPEILTAPNAPILSTNLLPNPPALIMYGEVISLLTRRTVSSLSVAISGKTRHYNSKVFWTHCGTQRPNISKYVILKCLKWFSLCFRSLFS